MAGRLKRRRPLAGIGCLAATEDQEACCTRGCAISRRPPKAWYAASEEGHISEMPPQTKARP